MTTSEKPIFSIGEKILFGAAIIGVAFVMFIMTLLAPQRYRLPNGDIVECSKMVETSKGNFHLYGCKHGTEYYVQGTVEIIGE